MKGTSRVVSAAVLCILLLALAASPIQSRKIVKDGVQSGGNVGFSGTSSLCPPGPSPVCYGNENRPPPPVKTEKHH